MMEISGFKFLSSSLLLIYDGSSKSNDEAIIRLIDFENTEVTIDRDNNVIEGIQNLLKILGQIYELDCIIE